MKSRLFSLLYCVWLLLWVSICWSQSSGINGGGPTGGGGGGGTPGGSNNQVQINAAGSFGGITNGASGTVLTSTGASSAPTFQTISGTGTVTSLTAGTGITLTPNPITATGTVALTTPIAQSNILTCAANQIVFDNTTNQLACSNKFLWTDSTQTLLLGSNLTQGTLTSATGEQLNIASGAAATASNLSGGEINIVSGTGDGSGSGGILNFNGGTGGTSSGSGGGFILSGGTGGSPVGNGGNLTISGGTGSGVAGGTGGALGINGGTGGTSTGNGGNSLLQGGSSGNSGNNGGSISLPGGVDSGIATNVVITPAIGVGVSNSGSVILQDATADNTLAVDPFGNVLCACATGTTATDKFVYLGISSGVPTGVPAHTTGVYANSAPVRVDITDHRLYFYDGSWRNVANFPTSPLTVGTINLTTDASLITVNSTTAYYDATDPGGGFSMFLGQGAGTNAGVSSAAKGFFTCFGYQTCGGAGAGTINAGQNIELTAVGWSAASKITTGLFDTAYGTGAMRNESTTSNNTAIGVDSMGLSVGMSSSTALGVAALKTGACNACVAVGQNSQLGGASTASVNNTSVGYNSLSSASLTTASHVTAVGYQAGIAKTTGNYDVYLGDSAGQAVTTGSHLALIGANSTTSVLATGSGDTSLGYNCESNFGAADSNKMLLCAGAGPVITTTGGGTPSTSTTTIAGVMNATGGVQSNGTTINTVLSGTTGSIGGSALLAGQCSAGTVTITGAATSMVATTSPSSDPDSSLSTGVGIYAFVSAANTVTVRICAIVAVTPAASTYNVRVLQ